MGEEKEKSCLVGINGPQWRRMANRDPNWGPDEGPDVNRQLVSVASRFVFRTLAAATWTDKAKHLSLS